MNEKFFLENINDEINNLQQLKLRKNTKTYLKHQLSKLDLGLCPQGEIFSLLKALGLDQPLGSERLSNTQLNIQVYNNLIPLLRKDVANFNQVLFV